MNFDDIPDFEKLDHQRLARRFNIPRYSRLVSSTASRIVIRRLISVQSVIWHVRVAQIPEEGGKGEGEWA